MDKVTIELLYFLWYYWIIGIQNAKDITKEECFMEQISFDDEMNYIVAHGILHLLGFDHLTESDYNYMVDVQNRAKAIFYDKI